MGGSPFNVTTAEDRKHPVQRRVESDLARLAELALDTDLPLLFTCYGIGVLTRVLGGAVGTAHGEEAPAVEIVLTDAGVADPLVGVLPERFDALVGHKEATDRLPDDAVLLASSAACPVQIYRVGRRVYATQFHPEVSTARLRRPRRGVPTPRLLPGERAARGQRTARRGIRHRTAAHAAPLRRTRRRVTRHAHA